MLAQEEIVLIKGKRSKRPRPLSPLALTMPTSPSTSAGGSGDSGGGAISDVMIPSCSKMTRGRDEEEEDMANCLILLAKGQTRNPSPAAVSAASPAAEAATGVNYRCQTCNKSFSSFQALGGHRASHNKKLPIKPLLALDGKKPLTDTIEQESSLSSHGEITILSLQTPSRDLIISPEQNKTIRVHECSICGAEFASGQALGGHMRRHRPLPTAAISSYGESPDRSKRQRAILSLDLNLPAPEDINHHQRENKITSAVPQEQVIVFTASSLVDCHY